MRNLSLTPSRAHVTVRAAAILMLAALLPLIAHAAPSAEAVAAYDAGMAAKKAGDMDLARTELRKALEVAGGDYEEALWALAWVDAGRSDASRLDEAVPLFLRLAARGGQRSAEARAVLGRIVPLSGEWSALSYGLRQCPNTQWSVKLRGHEYPITGGDALVMPETLKAVLVVRAGDGADLASIARVVRRVEGLRARTKVLRGEKDATVEALGPAPSGARNLSEELVVAASCGDLAEVKALLVRGARPNGPDQWLRPLSSAARHGHLDVMKALLARGASVNAAGFCGETPLHAAAGRGDLEMVRLLISKGARVNVR